MADEARINSSLQIRISNGDTVLLDYTSRPNSFTADVSGTKGPSPGAFSVPVTGKIINLEELVQPGLYRISNLDATNFFEYGIYDPQTDLFYPWGECLPGESYIGRFSRNIMEEYLSTGTGTTGSTNRIFLKANTAAVVALLEAFEV